MKQTSIDELKRHLFESIEMLKNQNDPKADACEKMDVKTAREVANTAQTIISIYKIELQAVNMLAKADNPVAANKLLISAGFTSGNLTAIPV